MLLYDHQRLRSNNMSCCSPLSEYPALQHQQQHESSEQEIIFDLHNFDMATNWSEIFNISGNFLGFTKVWAEIRRDKEVLVSQVKQT